MTAQWLLMLKVLLVSAVGSALIKYGVVYGLGTSAIAPSQVGAGIAIVLPSILLGIILWWRSQQSPSL